METGLVLYKVIKRSYNTDAFGDFVDDLVAALAAEQVEGDVVVTDNVAFHKARVIHNPLLASAHSTLFRLHTRRSWTPQRIFLQVEAASTIGSPRN